MMTRILFFIGVLFFWVSINAQTFHAFNPYPIAPGGGQDAMARFLMENNPDDEEGEYDGSNQNGIGYSSSVYKQGSYSLLQNGSDRHVLVPATGTIDLGNSFSISFWYRAGSGTSAMVVGQMESSNGFNIWVDIDNEYFSFITGEGGTLTEADCNGVTSIDADQFEHYVVVVDDVSSGTATLYVNGTDETDDSTCDDAYNTDDDIWIGVRKDGAWDAWGYIDDFQIYPFGLTSTEVTTLFNNPGTEIER